MPANTVHRKHTTTWYTYMCMTSIWLYVWASAKYRMWASQVISSTQWPWEYVWIYIYIYYQVYIYIYTYVWKCASLTLSVISFLENCLKLLGNWKSILWQRNETPINFNFRHAILRTSTPSWRKDEASRWWMAINLYALIW